MKRVVYVLYGVAAYGIFFVTFLYALGFVGNIMVPKSIDAGFQGGSGNAWLVDILLLSLFALQHSVMARQGFKHWWTRIVPQPLERSTYVLLSNVVLIALFLFWRPIEGVVWHVEDTVAASVLTGVYFFGWAMVLVGSFLINHLNLFGLEQVTMGALRRTGGPVKFIKPLFYKIVRHPMMLGFIIGFWAAPVMTVGHLLFAFASTGYILTAIQLEERDLVHQYGEEYRRYQREVPQIVPLPMRKHAEVGAHEPV